MTLALPVPDIDPALTDLDQARMFAEARTRVLRELTGIGMQLARALARQVEEMTTPTDAATEGQAAPRPPLISVDPGLAFSRIARAVRMTVALEARQDEERLVLGEKLQTARIEDVVRRRREARAPIDARKYAIRRRLEAQIETLAGEDADEDEVDEQLSQLYDRMEEACEAEDFMDRPFEELIAAIRKDLGLDPTPPAAPADDALASEPARKGAEAALARSRAGAREPDLTAEDVARAWGMMSHAPDRPEARAAGSGGSS